MVGRSHINGPPLEWVRVEVKMKLVHCISHINGPPLGFMVRVKVRAKVRVRVRMKLVHWLVDHI